MLSYRHEFHAGNHADILKHVTIQLIAEHLTKKPSPFVYIDTHAGGGLYNIDSDSAVQTGEASDGVLQLLKYTNAGLEPLPEELASYMNLCRSLLQLQRLYPGSPKIAAAAMRPQDSLVLSELHPQEIERLRLFAADDSRIHVHHRNGFELLKSIVPPRQPLPVRGIVLVDPGYEDVIEYQQTATAIINAAKSWTAGIFAVWYPLIDRRSTEIAQLKRSLRDGCSGDSICAELCVRSPGMITEGNHIKNLYGSGMIVIRPPWLLEQKLSVAMQYVLHAIGESGCQFTVSGLQS